MRTSFL